MERKGWGGIGGGRKKSKGGYAGGEKERGRKE